MLLRQLSAGARFAQRPASRRSILIIFTILLSIGVYWLARTLMPGHELAARTLAILVIASIFWATETLPLFATAFVVIGLEIIFLATDGGLAHQLSRLHGLMGIETPPLREIKASQFFSPFAADIIILFMGGFLLSAALSKHRIDQAIAQRVLRPFCRSPLLLLYAVLSITAFFSMWMSNTATAAMMLAIISPIVLKFPKEDRFHRGLVLAVAFGANIGGIGTPIGTPPNAIAFGALKEAEYPITFLRWMMVAVPLEILLLAVVGVMLYVSFRPSPDLVIERPTVDQKISFRGWATVAVLGLALAMWLTGGWHGVRPGAVALIAAASLTALGVIDRHDVDSIDWNILILMWGGLSLSVALSESGLSDLIAQVNLQQVPGGSWMIAVIVTIVALVMSTVMSNTATASILVPMTLAAYLIHPEQYAMLVALACSFAMAMPVSTPPNAMAYATGHVPMQSMIRVGATMSIIALIVLLLGYKVMLDPVFGETVPPAEQVEVPIDSPQ